MKYQLKTEIIEAVQYNGINQKDIRDLAGDQTVTYFTNYDSFLIGPREVELKGGHWLVRYENGYLDVFDPQTFKAKYEPAPDNLNDILDEMIKKLRSYRETR